MQTETLIIGGGLSGLSLAKQLHDRKKSFLLVEGRTRLGGRMLTEIEDGGYFDLGPAWFWPGQPRIATLVESAGLRVFEQFYQGEICMEDELGQVHRGRGYASMQGSYRVVGGMRSVIDALAERLPKDKLRLDWAVRSLKKTSDGVVVTSETNEQITADRVVLALPPRVAGSLDFNPSLSKLQMDTMKNIPTWMAGQAKAVAVYDNPFWREEGLSGDAMSRRGPMVEIHDASPAETGPYALFGFIGIPPQARQDEAALKQAVLAQLVRIFGSKASSPKSIHLKDWAFDRFTATELDQRPLAAHPHYGLPAALKDVWNGALLLSGTETAHQFGGYIEGALEAAEETCTVIESEAFA